MNRPAKRCYKSCILLTLLLCVWLYCPVNSNTMDVQSIIQKLNEEHKYNMHLMIDLKVSNGSQKFEEIGYELEVPRILISHTGVVKENFYKIFNMKILTIVRMDMTNLNITFSIMEKLLWRRHYITITILFQNEDLDLEELFHRCWKQGHTSVLLYWRNSFYSYTAFPNLRVNRLTNLSQFLDYEHHQNFQHYKIKVPFVEIPPLCFSYHNRQGHYVRSGIYYKIVENFVTHYNGCLQHEFIDIWKLSLQREYATDLVASGEFAFITSHLAMNESYENSESFNFAALYLIVPAGNEIDQSLYLLVSFNSNMWLMIFLLLFVLFLFIVVVNYCKYGKLIYFDSLLHALKIVIFAYDEVFKGRTFFNYMLHLLFLIVGLFLTNSYVCNLSSMYTSRIYEPDLKTLQDIERTNLGIHVYSLDYDQYLAVKNLPSIVHKRMFVGNNTEFYINRRNLNLVSIYPSVDDIVDFVLFQQLYVKRPWAKYLPEPMYTIPSTIKLPHRSPYIRLFNRHLSYMRDSGILKKIKTDSQWDGVLSSSIRFFQDTVTNRSMSMVHLQYAFVMWLSGMLLGFLIFIGEIIFGKKCH
ncbi:uncharacterized protein LOC106084299 [Stomoxys calcitrans]|uniref:uncharacterized protein LOC106084299 n=1 Tax=Stomoxys calcitrans TaxID=35570 RepID=UPI0027E25900|nr:uncharacterized protein LOC106084299 [Stomoxys calcitrans]